MRNKLYIKTFGCQMNDYDSSRMADALRESHGLELTQDETQADVLILNTCSIREKAQEKVFSQLGRWNQLKEKNPALVIGVGGCVASQEGAALRERAPYVDLVFGPQTLHRLPDMLRKLDGQVGDLQSVPESSSAGTDEFLDAGATQLDQQDGEHHVQKRKAQYFKRIPIVDISFPEIEKFDSLPAPKVDGASAFLSIMEGCSKYCTFCVVPYTRGEEISRSFDSVMLEVEQLVAQGVKEITLLGQNVNAYRGAMDDGVDGEEAGEADLALLLHYVAAVDGVERLRYTTSHPVEFSDSLIAAHGEISKLANQVHLPVQSGSDRILALMKRGHNIAEYKAKIRRLRQANPEISLSSDFIVGFPGETEADFAATMDLIDEIGFDNSYSFIYSPRPGTPAEAMPDDVPHAVKQARLARLQQRIIELATEHSQAMIGTQQQVLIERVSRKRSHELAGRTSNNRIVNFPGSVDLIGQFVDVVITEVQPNSLRGELLA